MEKKKLFVAVFLSFILITSVLGFILSYETDQDQGNSITGDNQVIIKEINGLKIERLQNGVYSINKNGIQVVFNYLPEELNDIKVPEFSFMSDKIYIIFDPEAQDSNMAYLFGKTTTGLNSAGYRTVFACSKEEGCNIDIPVKDCSNYGIYIIKNNQSKIYNKDKCLVLQGDYNNLNRFIDKLNYKVIGVE